MSDTQAPSKELAERLRALDFGVRMPPSVIEEAAEFLESLSTAHEPPADHICGPWAQCDAACAERAYSQPEANGVKCVHCNGSGEETQVYDEQNGWSEEKPCATCNGTGRITTVDQYLKTLPANWHENSSLETWFPCTAAELERLRASQPPAAGQSAHDNPPPWHGKRVYIVPVELQNGGEASTEAVFRACGITFWIDDTSPPTKGANDAHR